MSTPDATKGPMRPQWRGTSGWSMRTRLVAAMLALIAVVSLVIGVVSVLALHRFLADRLDNQLTTAAGRSSGAYDDRDGGPGRGDPDDGPGPAFLFVPGQGEGTLGAFISNDQVVTAAVLDPSGKAQALTPQAVQELATLPLGPPTTRDLGPGLGDYRLLATRTLAGDVLVTGLPLSGVRATVLQLAAVIALVAALGLVGRCRGRDRHRPVCPAPAATGGCHGLPGRRASPRPR